MHGKGLISFWLSQHHDSCTSLRGLGRCTEAVQAAMCISVKPMVTAVCAVHSNELQHDTRVTLGPPAGLLVAGQPQLGEQGLHQANTSALNLSSWSSRAAVSQLGAWHSIAHPHACMRCIQASLA